MRIDQLMIYCFQNKIGFEITHPQNDEKYERGTVQVNLSKLGPIVDDRQTINRMSWRFTRELLNDHVGTGTEIQNLLNRFNNAN